MRENGAKGRLAAAMVIFGTIGLFVRWIRLPSAMIAMLRGYIGFLFLLGVLRARKKPADRAALRRNLAKLVLSGAFIGINWILLFEAYRYTSVAVATLCYYMQPVFVTAASALLFRERLTLRRAVCMLAALAGMSMVSGVWEGAGAGDRSLTGVLLGVGAALFYALVILTNKKMDPMEPVEQTAVQLLSAAVTVTPYVLLTAGRGDLSLSGSAVLLVLLVGVLHTGYAYVLYFGQMQRLSAQTVAIMSYIDPVVAVLLSATLLREPLSLFGWAGAALVLGATLLSELQPRSRPEE